MLSLRVESITRKWKNYKVRLYLWLKKSLMKRKSKEEISTKNSKLLRRVKITLKIKLRLITKRFKMLRTEKLKFLISKEPLIMK